MGSLISAPTFLIITMVLLSLYFLPAMLAIGRRHVNALPVFLTNLYLGWTLIGWVVALIWALTQPQTNLAAQTGAPAAAQVSARKFSFKKKHAKIAACVAGGLLVLFVLLGFLVAPPQTAGTRVQQGAVKTKPAPVQSGVPMPANDLIGGE